MNVNLFLEIKNEYTEHLIDTLTPYIYEGISSIYKEAVKISNETKCEDKVLLIFQKLLQSVSNWNQLKIEEETNRIKQSSNTADYLDDLVKAVVKSNIILLSYSNSISNVIGQSFYNSLTTATFIHRCYTECAKDAHNNPYLFYHEVTPLEMKRNQIVIQQNIQSSIPRAIRKILPLSVILKEYLINTINIIQEPPQNALFYPSTKIVSDKKMDPKLEKDVMQIIKTEEGKSEKQKIQDIMNIDKIIASIGPHAPVESTHRNNPAHRNTLEVDIPPHLIEDNDDIEIAKLGESDRKIININFDEEPTIEGSLNKKTVSGTTISTKPMPSRMYNLTSERIDPRKVDLIEEYGAQKGGAKKVRSAGDYSKIKRKSHN